MTVLSVISEYREELSLPRILAGTALLYILQYIVTIIYRLTFHPLAKIPGPILGHVNWWREAYYSIVKKGHFPHQYLQDHKKYGPIVRINPDEVHISDPSFFPKIYHVGSKFDRSKMFYGAFNARSMLTVPSHQEHRFLRSHFEPFFSRKHILSMNHTVQDLVTQLIRRMEEYANGTTTKPLNIPECTRALTTDAIFKVMIDNPDAERLLELENWGREMTGAELNTANRVMYFDMFFMPRIFGKKPIASIPSLVPKRVMRGMKADKLGFWYFRLKAEDEVERILREEGELKEERRGKRGFEVVAEEVLKREKLKESGLTPQYVAEELWFILLAGVETTAGVLTKAIFHTLNDPAIHKRLFEELKTAFPDKNQEMPYLQLETLPYLSAIIKEALRVGDTAPQRIPRVVPEPGIHYKDYFLPAGTIVGMSGYTQHRDESIFPNAGKFDPERWMGPEGKALEKHLIAFSAGSMGCMGKSLAYGEMYVTLGRIFRRFEMTLTDCDESDMEIREIYHSGFHSPEQRPIRVLVRHREE